MTHETLIPAAAKEIGNSPEEHVRYRFIDAGTIALSGEEGAGKSTLARSMAAALNARLFEGGKTMRELKGGTSATVGFQDRDVSVDQWLDLQQITLMSESSPQKPLVNESRLAGFLALYVPNEGKVIRINVTAPAKERMRRIRKRALEDWAEKKNQLLNQYLRGLFSEEEFKSLVDELDIEKDQLTIERIRHKEVGRRQEDIKQWTKVWPRLEGKDPLNPGTKIDGKRLYDLSVSTGKKSKAETLERVLNWLLENGHIERIGN